MNHQRLELSDKDAKPFMKMGIDTSVSLSVSGVIREIGKREHYSDVPMNGPSKTNGKKSEKPKEVPYVIIDIHSVSGKKGKPVEDLNEDELEGEIVEAKRGGDDEEEEE